MNNNKYQWNVCEAMKYVRMTLNGNNNLPLVRKNIIGQGVVAFSPAHVLSQQAFILEKLREHDGLPTPDK